MAEAIELHVQAAAQVRGTLLVGPCDSLWSATLRADFERDVLSNYTRLNRLLSDLGRPWEAATVLERILAVDPVMESVSRKLMRIYEEVGHPELADREYVRLCSALSDTQQTPSPSTVRAHRDIARRNQLRAKA